MINEIGKDELCMLLYKNNVLKDPKALYKGHPTAIFKTFNLVLFCFAELLYS